MRIAFTGHRDKTASEADLQALAAEFPDAVWVHGGAQGFDTQVAATARRHGITQEVIRPDYRNRTHSPKVAPLIRNKQIVDGADLLVACHDGRNSGGTAFTVRYAREKSVPVRVLACYTLPAGDAGFKSPPPTGVV